MLADWTTENPIIQELLNTYEHPSIPYYLYIPPTGPAKAMDSVLTPGQLLKAFGAEEKG